MRWTFFHRSQMLAGQGMVSWKLLVAARPNTIEHHWEKWREEAIMKIEEGFVPGFNFVVFMLDAQSDRGLYIFIFDNTEARENAKPFFRSLMSPDKHFVANVKEEDWDAASVYTNTWSYNALEHPEEESD